MILLWESYGPDIFADADIEMNKTKKILALLFQTLMATICYYYEYYNYTQHKILTSIWVFLKIV